MRYRTLDAARPDDLAAWLALWQRWPGREVQAHPEYARLFARTCDRVVCAVGEGPGGAVLFPLILRPIAAEPWARPGELRWDAVTPYGYGGPYTWGEEPRDHAAFWRAHEAWCADERLVSTFARLSLFPEQLAAMPGRVEPRAPNIAVPLDGGSEALWRGYDSRVRKWVRVAQAAGLHVELDRDAARLDAFIDVYRHTMERTGAEPWYFFPRSFFEALVARLRGYYAFFHTLREGEVVSSDLVLCSVENVYYFLGGTRAEAFPLGPNYLLKHHIACWASSEGMRRYVLGGGYVPGDGLFRYKRGFARAGEVPFRAACVTHDALAYADLVRRRAEFASLTGASWEPRPGFFPSYRATQAASVAPTEPASSPRASTPAPR
ncbi:GNAT family N-acetyltransferase [Anaeromyxobacter sp. Fw109-5]|uniref:GNAT family N-acetyltransferase n=1 Tax=Anaeromyxobacter sp. (strain Fw109-5) TaxID=404589 RepID=UPI0000ED73A0|nr:GNAT family N-acetyltransferase [Anaeromyxobacter sp. Fw109-5]ABS26835.1 hypothetical protein Anae109_2634 [Anaeromyxobacter sp. Fw109-5]